MLVAQAGEHPPPGRAHEEAALQQERLVHVLDGVGFFSDGHRQGGEPHRTSVELLQDEGEDLAVHAVETFVVHLEQAQGLQRYRRR